MDNNNNNNKFIMLASVVSGQRARLQIQGSRVQDSSPVIMVLMKSGSLFVESSMSWVYE